MKRPSGQRDIAYLLLSSAVAAMPAKRRDWGRAMLAELHQIHSPGERARFALSATRVALFPPRAAPPWWGVPAGLVIRAGVAAVATHAVAPAVGTAPLVLMAVPAAGAWGMVTIPALAGRPDGVVSVGQVAVAAGVMGCLVMCLATVQRYPQVLNTSVGHGWPVGIAFDVVSVGYLGMALLLSRLLPGTGRNRWYALAAVPVLAAGAGYYIARPSLVGLWRGQIPTGYLLACLAVPAVAALAASRRGSLHDGLEAAAWAALFGTLITAITIIAATSRVAATADRSQPIIADAHSHGVASASVWLAGDNLGGAVFLLVWAACIFLVVAFGGALLGCALSAARSAGSPGGGREAVG